MTLADLPNLGPTTERMLHGVGLASAEDLRSVGAPMAYLMLRHRYGTRVTRVALWALAGAIDGRHWLSFSASEKAALDEAAMEELVVG